MQTTKTDSKTKTNKPIDNVINLIADKTGFKTDIINRNGGVTLSTDKNCHVKRGLLGGVKAILSPSFGKLYADKDMDKVKASLADGNKVLVMFDPSKQADSAKAFGMGDGNKSYQYFDAGHCAFVADIPKIMQGLKTVKA